MSILQNILDLRAPFPLSNFRPSPSLLSSLPCSQSQSSAEDLHLRYSDPPASEIASIQKSFENGGKTRASYGYGQPPAFFFASSDQLANAIAKANKSKTIATNANEQLQSSGSSLESEWPQLNPSPTNKSKTNRQQNSTMAASSSSISPFSSSDEQKKQLTFASIAKSKAKAASSSAAGRTISPKNGNGRQGKTTGGCSSSDKQCDNNDVKVMATKEEAANKVVESCETKSSKPKNCAAPTKLQQQIR